MSQRIKPKLLFKGPVKVENINISLNPISNRKIDEEIEKGIEEIWQKRLVEAAEKGQKIWNSVNYRLNNFSFDKDKLNLEFSLIEFYIRNSIKDVEKVYSLSEEYYTKGLFITSLIKTSDNKYVFGKRTANILNTNKEDLIGGILSKDENEINNSRDLEISLINEIEEEINVSRKYIESNVLLGMVLSDTCNVGVIFKTEISIDSLKVKELFNAENDEEMKDLVFIEEKDLVKYLESLAGYKTVVVEMIK